MSRNFEYERKQRNLKQKNKVEGRCANQRTQLALMNSKVKDYKDKLNKAIEAIRMARDAACSTTQDCPKCAFIDDYLTKALSDLANEEENRIVNLRTLLKECKNEFIKISTMACYPETRLSHPADFDELFNKCEEKITRINAAIGESEE